MDDLLTRGIETLRAPVRVRPSWRHALLSEIIAERPPVVQLPRSPRATRVWALRPAAALLAAAVILTMGLAAGLYLGRETRPIVAAAPNADKLTTVRFVIHAPAARSVSLVGDFNGWDVNANPMRASRDGQRWVLEVPLTSGRHTYAFVVDGDVLRDPAAPSVVDDDFGVRNSVIFVNDGST